MRSSLGLLFPICEFYRQKSLSVKMLWEVGEWTCEEPGEVEVGAVRKCHLSLESADP